jgi:hypothetical protein
MRAQPVDDLLSLDSGQHIHYTPRRQLDVDGSKPPATTKRELVDANRWANDGRVEREGAHLTQQR